MLPLHTHLQHSGLNGQAIFKVVDSSSSDVGDWPANRSLLWGPGNSNLDAENWGGLITPDNKLRPQKWSGVWAHSIAQHDVIKPGDVIRLREGSTLASVLYRRGSASNSLFATERCNSLCLMCSQPPREVDDSWRVTEHLEVLDLVDKTERQLGITGGEPTLLGEGLASILFKCKNTLPETTLHILTNGRNFRNAAITEMLMGVRHPRAWWAVPLYADSAAVHDYVVQARGAFHETIEGLLQLARYGANVELRVVLHKQTIPRLPELAHFIYRNLPFVRHVALMGLEPMGFAKSNRDALWMDPADYQEQLAAACHHLHNRGMNVSIYNLQLCVLPEHLWPFARQSISDWKNNYAPECESCVTKEECAGFFKSAGPAWRSRNIRPLKARKLEMEQGGWNVN